MLLTPPSIDVGPDDGFENGSDIFDYAEFGQGFADLVCSIKQPLTVMLDGPWGSGKTTFVKQWAGLLRNSGAPVITFDAFANDHHEDAFVALAGQIIGAAKSELGSGKSVTRKMVASAKKAGVALMPLTMKMAIRTATFGLIHHADIEDLGDTVTSLSKKLVDEAAKAAESAISAQVTKASEEAAALNTFRTKLMELAAALSEKAADEDAGQEPKPLIFIVDELDRCRPPFALNLLERVKHLFSVPGVVFVIVTNLDHMSSVIEGAYGSGVQGQLYLEKFYDLRAVLPNSEEDRNQSVNKYLHYLWRSMELDCQDAGLNQRVRKILSELAQHHDLSLRRIERIATNVALSYAALGTSFMKDPELIVGISVLRQIDPAKYELARRGLLSWEDTKDLFKIDAWDDENAEWFENTWRYLTDTSADESEEWFKGAHQSFRRNGFRDRLTVVPWATKMIDHFTTGS